MKLGLVQDDEHAMMRWWEKEREKRRRGGNSASSCFVCFSSVWVFLRKQEPVVLHKDEREAPGSLLFYCLDSHGRSPSKAVTTYNFIALHFVRPTTLSCLLQDLCTCYAREVWFCLWAWAWAFSGDIFWYATERPQRHHVCQNRTEPHCCCFNHTGLAAMVLVSYDIPSHRT